MFLIIAVVTGLVRAAEPRLVLATDALLQWSGGRTWANVTTGAVAIDLENTRLTLVVGSPWYVCVSRPQLMQQVANASFVGLQVLDASQSGALLSVGVSNSAIPGFRVATLVTSSFQQLYTLATGAQLMVPTPSVITVTLLSEFSLIGDHTPFSLLQIAGIVTDGTLLPPAPLPTRRLLFLGDSLSSGVGTGHNMPDAPATCGAGVLLDDSTSSWPSLTCAALNATCETIAASGWTLFASQPNIPGVLNLSLPSMVFWPPEHRAFFNFADHPTPDAVVVELGENDCHAGNCSSPEFRSLLTAAYVAFVQELIGPARYNAPKLNVLLTIAPHEAGQSAAMLVAVDELRAVGIAASFVNATVSSAGLPVGCAGHPSAQTSALAAVQATRLIAAALGWH